MFGGESGPFRSRRAHAFDETTPIYRQPARILADTEVLAAINTAIRITVPAGGFVVYA